MKKIIDLEVGYKIYMCVSLISLFLEISSINEFITSDVKTNSMSGMRRA